MVWPAYEYVAEPSALGSGDKTASGLADTVIVNGGQRCQGLSEVGTAPGWHSHGKECRSPPTLVGIANNKKSSALD